MSMGQWLFDEAATTGDWESAAIALRTELEQATKDRDVLIASREHAWTLVAMARQYDAFSVLSDFASEVTEER